jgi:hypothetical protein
MKAPFPFFQGRGLLIQVPLGPKYVNNVTYFKGCVTF